MRIICKKCRKKKVYAKDLCWACYSRERFKDPNFKSQHKVYVYNWRDRNLERWREIQRKASRKYYLKKREQKLVKLKAKNLLKKLPAWYKI